MRVLLLSLNPTASKAVLCLCVCVREGLLVSVFPCECRVQCLGVRKCASVGATDWETGFSGFCSGIVTVNTCVCIFGGNKRKSLFVCKRDFYRLRV